MTIGAVLVLLAICGGLALLMCLPVMLIARRLRSKPVPAANAGLLHRRIPSHELPGLAAGVVVLFLGFAQAYLAPDSWFGRQMATNTGRFVFGIGLYLAGVLCTIAMALWAARRRRK